MGPFAAQLGLSMLSGATNGSLFGSTNSSSTNGKSRSRNYITDATLNRLRGSFTETDAASGRAADVFRTINAGQRAALQRAFDEQLAAVAGVGGQEIADLNRRYNGARGAVGQRTASRGTYNTTIAPAMQAMVERERNAAVGAARDRQSRLFGQIYGQRNAQLAAAESAAAGRLSSLAMGDYQLRGLIPAALASNRTTDTRTRSKTKTKKGGLFSGLFG